MRRQRKIASSLTEYFSQIPQGFGIYWNEKFFQDREAVDLYSRFFNGYEVRPKKLTRVFMAWPNTFQAAKIPSPDIQSLRQFFLYGITDLNGIIQDKDIPNEEDFLIKSLEESLAYLPNPAKIGGRIVFNPAIFLAYQKIISQRYDAYIIKHSKGYIRIRPWECWVIVAGLKHRSLSKGYAWKPQNTDLLNYLADGFVFAELDGEYCSIRFEDFVENDTVQVAVDVPKIRTISIQERGINLKNGIALSTDKPFYVPHPIGNPWVFRAHKTKKHRIITIFKTYRDFFNAKRSLRPKAILWKRYKISIQKNKIVALSM